MPVQTCRFICSCWFSLLLLGSCLLPSAGAVAQSPKIDSLMRVLAQTPTDTGRSVVLSLLAAAQAEAGQLEYADSLARRGESLAARRHFARGIGLNRLRRAFVQINRGNFAAARPLCWQALAQLQPFDAALGHNYLGAIYKIEGRLDSAHWHFEQALAHGGLRAQAVASLNLGVIESNTGRLPQAVDRYLKALQVARAVKDRRLEGTLLLNIGAVYAQLGESAQALEWFGRAIALFKRYRLDHASLALAYYNSASAAHELGQTDRHRRFVAQAYALADSIGDVNTLALAGASLAQLAIAERDWPRARHLLEQAEAAAAASGSVENQVRLANVRANYYMARGDWSATRRHARRAVQLLEQYPQASELVLAYGMLYVADSAQGRLADALRHFKLKTAWRDSLREQSKALEIGRLEARYQAQQELEAQRQRMQDQIARRDRWLVGTGLGVLLLAGLAVLLNYLRRQQRRRNQLLRSLSNHIYRQKAEIEDQNSEIAAQRNRLEEANQKLVDLDRMKEELTGMIVHDLKNPLNAILALTSLPPDTSRLLMMRAAGQQMSQLVSNLLDIQKYENAALKLSIQPIQAAILWNRAIEQTTLLTQAKSLDIRLDLQAGLVVEADAELLVRVLVNLLTNAIKYAPSGDTLDLRAQYEADQGAVFSITDHGQGIPPDQLERIFDKYAQVGGGVASGRLRSTGLGLTFCRLTIEAHGGRIAARSEVGRYTTFIFNLPHAFVEKSQGVESDGLSGSQTREPMPELPPSLRQKYASVLDTLASLPIYELSQIYDLLDRITEPEVQIWRASVEVAALAGLEDDYRRLVKAKEEQKTK